MSEKVLLVDDDPIILKANAYLLYKRFDVDTALGPEAGFRVFTENGPHAVVIADRQMPGMDGAEFLAKIKQRSPDTIRVMLTGDADLESTIAVVNRTNVFRFLTKPCEPDLLVKTIEEGLREHTKITAEREILETLHGTTRILAELLSTVDPQSAGRAEKIRHQIRPIAHKLREKKGWEWEFAAILSSIGRVTIPAKVLQKNYVTLSAIERDMLTRVPEIGRQLLINIPRLEGVADIVYFQNKNFDGSGFPSVKVAGDAIPHGARVLRILLDLEELESAGVTRGAALQKLKGRTGRYDPTILELVATLGHLSQHANGPTKVVRELPVRELEVGQMLASTVETRTGLLIVNPGHTISPAILEKIRNFSKLFGVKEPIHVQVTENEAAAA